MTKHPKEAERLKKIVESFPKITVTVVGDLVADEFIFGEISRVSREAPVLILKHRERTVVPGGGANAINNLADLGVNVLPVGVVGDDEAGRLLLKAFRHKHIPVSGVLKDKSYTTVTKTRILAGMTHTVAAAGGARRSRTGNGAQPSLEARTGAGSAPVRARLGCPADFGLRLRRGESGDSRLRSASADVSTESPSFSIRVTACCNIPA